MPNSKRVLVDGKLFESKSAACLALGVPDHALTYALKTSGMIGGVPVSLAPSGYVEIEHHRIDKPLALRAPGMPLILEPVTHRLGAYRGGSV